MPFFAQDRTALQEAFDCARKLLKKARTICRSRHDGAGQSVAGWYHSRIMKWFVSILLATSALLCGCLSPERARKEADEDAYRIIRNGASEVGLSPSVPFSVERPSEVLRRRLMVAQSLPSATNPAPAWVEREPVELSLRDCFQVGARNSNAYQDQKESVFQAALALDLQQFAFGSTYSGSLTGSYESDHSGDEAEHETSGGFSTGITRTLKNGTKLAGMLSLDVVKLLTGDRESAYGLLLDASITIPLLRGAGRDVVTEPLTQAQRDVLYALLLFERYRQEFVLEIATQFLGVLQAADRVMIAVDNLKRLERGFERSEELAEAGRLPKTEVGQTEQDVLRARNSVVSTRQKEAEARDAFKRTLGLPPDAHIEFDSSVFDELRRHVDRGAVAEAVLIREALERRGDMRVALGRVEDAERKRHVAAIALKAGVELTVSGSSQERRNRDSDTSDIHFNNGNYGAGLDIELPWEMRDERNRYREALMDVEKARRSAEEKEDAVKADVRTSLRRLAEAWETYRIQESAVKLAEQRVGSAEMFVEAGRAQTRDLLEAQEALVNARSALTGALVSYHVARWSLLLGTGALPSGGDIQLYVRTPAVHSRGE